jgi:hypothetical protein
MGTCTFIDYMIGTISFSRLYKMDTVFFCDFCTAVQCAPKLGVFYLKCWQSTDLSEGVYSASIETNPWHSLSAPAIRALVDCTRACGRGG